MKKSRVVALAAVPALIVLTAAFILLFRKGESPRADVPASGTEYYTCPMHPSVIAYKPGPCPVCGMTLVKKIAGGGAGAGDSLRAGEVRVSQGEGLRANISTYAARRTAFSVSVAASGVVAFAEPSQSVVAARGRGRIEHLFVRRTGEAVRKGEPLLSVYSPDLISAEEEFLIALSGDSLSAPPVVAAASRRRLAERFGLTPAQISRLERDHDVSGPAVYASPIAGTVIRKAVVEGQYVDEGMTLLEIADLSRVWVIASVAEQDIRSVSVGERVELAVEAYPGRTFGGRVSFIEPVLDADSRSVRVRVEIANTDGALKVNMYARMTLKPPPREALVVPTSAVLFTGGEPRVWVEDSPGRFVPRAVKVGASAGGFTEILGGVEEGCMVAATGGFLVDSESQLENQR